jgi:two-component system response regulator MprA
MRVPIVEDDAKLARVIKQGIEEEGNSAIICSDGAQALQTVEGGAIFDVIVLDVMLPKLDVLTVARRLRAAGGEIPILMLTGRDASADVVRGLDAGADDYLTKPFSFEVLLARLRALVRRGSRTISYSVLRAGDLALDIGAHEVRRGELSINLTRTEFSILECLMRRAGRVVTRQTLLDEVWGDDREVGNNTIDAFMRLLRSKVDVLGHSRLIHTVRGIGYCVREDS